MAFRYYDGTYEPRPCIDLLYCGGICYAKMVNDDLTFENVYYDDADYGAERRLADPRIDASEELIERVRQAHIVGKMPHFTGMEYQSARAGDVVEVVKGRKYPVGQKIVIAKTFEYFVHSYDRVGITYIVGTKGERIQAKNTVVCALGQKPQRNDEE